MSVSAKVENGNLVDYPSSIAKNLSGGNTMDKDAFLKLLVAQMKYQDPLEPTSNTEFIAQYASFSQVEQLQNMSANLDLSRASSYVGQTVTIRTKMPNGEMREIEGKVDFVVFENNKALVSVNGVLYSASDVYAVVESEYKWAFDLATAFKNAIDGLPDINNIALSDAEVIYNLRDGFNGMSSYQQDFIANSLLIKLGEYVAKIDELKKLADAGNDDGGDPI